MNLKKILYIIIIIAITIISLSVVYYLVIFLPQTQKNAYQNKEQELVINCMKDGRKLYEEDTTDSKEENAIIISPEFHYNQKLKTCLYSRFYIDCSLGQDECSNNYIVKDVYSNKIITSFVKQGEVQMSKINLDEFKKQKDILMNE